MRQRILAMVLALAVCLGVAATAATAFAFSDVADAEMAQAVSVLSGMGIVDGCSDGGFHPADTLTRAQFCKLAVLLENQGDEASTSSYRSLFTDVPSDHWAVGYINLAYTEGLVSGYGDGTFGPDDPVTTAQAVTILLHILGWSNSDIGPFWPEDYISKATKLGLLDAVTAGSADALTRGQAALLLYACLDQDTAGGEDFLSVWASSTVDSALVMERDAESTDGRLHTLKVYANGGITYYEQANTVDERLVGRRGTLLLSKSGKVTGFVPDRNLQRTVFLTKVEADGVTDENGTTYAISSTTAALALDDEERSTYGACWYDMEGSTLADLFYTESGSIDLVVFDGGGRYEGVTLTGYYENAAPNASAPDTVTLLGHTFTVSDEGKKSLKQYKVGEKITVVLNGSGEVAAAYAASEKKTELIGVLDSVSGTTATVTLTSGVTATGTVSSSASDLVGGLVKVNSTAVGKLSVFTLSGGVSAGKLDVTAGTLGKLSLAGDVKLYDRVGQNCTVEVELDDLLVDTVAAGSIGYVGVNDAGQVDLIVLEDVTGNCYTYGYYEIGSEQSGTGDMAVSNTTVAVRNSEGSTAKCLTGKSVKGSIGGLACTADNKVAGLAALSRLTGVSRADFSGTDTVVAGGYVLLISENVQVYNDASDTWTTLEEAKAFSGDFTLYYDRTPETGGQVRMIVVK